MTEDNFLLLPPKGCMYKAKWEPMRIEDADYWIKSYNAWAKSVNDRLDSRDIDSPEPEWSEACTVLFTRFPKSCLVFSPKGSVKTGVIAVTGFKAGWQVAGESRRLIKARLLLANSENVRWGGWSFSASYERFVNPNPNPHHGA